MVHDAHLHQVEHGESSWVLVNLKHPNIAFVHCQTCKHWPHYQSKHIKPIKVIQMSLTRKNKSQNKHKTRICLAHPQSSPEWPRKHKSLSFIFLSHLPGSDYSLSASEATWREKGRGLPPRLACNATDPRTFLNLETAARPTDTEKYKFLSRNFWKTLQSVFLSPPALRVWRWKVLFLVKSFSWFGFRSFVQLCDIGKTSATAATLQ